MTLVNKSEFAVEIGVSATKMDSLMNELGFEYETTPRNKKIRIVSNEAQIAIKDYLGIK